MISKELCACVRVFPHYDNSLFVQIGLALVELLYYHNIARAKQTLNEGIFHIFAPEKCLLITSGIWLYFILMTSLLSN